MSRAGWIAALVVVAVIGGGAWWYLDGEGERNADRPATSVTYNRDGDDEGTPPPEPPDYPLVEAPAGTGADDAGGDADEDAAAPERTPLPALGNSDDAVRDATGALPGAAPLEARLVPERLIEKFVVTVNSLDGTIAPLSMWPVEDAEGVPEVDRQGEDRFEWSAANADRYDPYVAAFTTPDAETLAALYARYYPLLQEAFASLGQDEDYFNDRFIAIIDHLLAAPPARERYRLVRPRVLYQFADPGLEALSSGQKLMLRLGPEHSQAVREQLRALRAAIVTRTGNAAGAGSGD